MHLSEFVLIFVFLLFHRINQARSAHTGGQVDQAFQQAAGHPGYPNTLSGVNCARHSEVSIPPSMADSGWDNKG